MKSVAMKKSKTFETILKKCKCVKKSIEKNEKIQKNKYI